MDRLRLDRMTVRLTPSWKFFFACLAFIVGIGSGSVLELASVTWYVLAWVAVVALAFAALTRSRLAMPMLVVAAFLAGTFRVSLAAGPPLPAYLPSSVDSVVHVFHGEVVTDPQPHARSVRFTLRLASVDGRPVQPPASLSVLARQYPEISRGDTVTIRCRLVAGQAQPALPPACLFPELHIDARAKLGFVGHLVELKERYLQSLGRVFPEPAAGFIAGLLVGGRGVVSDAWRSALNATGTTHLIALSGFNVTIIAGFILLALQRFGIPRRWHAAVIGAILFVFVITVGAGASIVRAAIMGMLVVIARQSGRFSISRNAIAATAVLMLLIDPTLLAADVGFQLSFLATLGIVYLYPVFVEWTADLPNPLEVKDALLMALAAEIFVTPLMLYDFDRFSVVSPFVNMLVVPPVPLIMLFGFLGGLGGLVFLPLGQALGFGAWLGATYVLSIIEFFAKLPFAAVEVSCPAWLLAFYYTGLGAWLIWYYWRTSFASVRPLF